MSATFRVLIADELSPRAVEILSAHPEIEVRTEVGLKPDALKAALEGVHALAVRSATKVTADVLDSTTHLRVVGRAGIGVDNIDVKAASRRGVIVMNTPAGNAVTTAEHALCLLASLARRIPQATASIKAGKWEKKKFQGTELCDKTLGVLGLGNIGRIVADRAQGLRMKVIAYDPVLTDDAARRLGVELLPFDEVLRRADFLTVHTPLLPETKNLINAEAFKKMKDGVLLVNAARGGIVDEAALADAIAAGKVAGAALDVFSEEPPPKDHPVLGALLAQEQVIATPHLGASTDEAQEKVAVELAEQIVAYLLRGEIKNAVNLPSVPREVQERLAPYLELADRLGTMAAQLCTGIESVDVEVVGEVADAGTRALAAAAIAGLLRPHLDMPVTQVNAMLLAAERGIRVTEIKRAHGANFTSSVALRLDGKCGHRLLKGTVFQTEGGPEPRLVQIDNFLLEAIPEGHILVVHNDDKPGVIGAVGTLLGRRGLNVSRMQVGLAKQGGGALQLWNVDGDVAAVLDEVRAQAHVRSAMVVSLDAIG